MTVYVLRRLLLMIPVLLIGSLLVFVVIQLPPGTVIDAKIAQLRNRGFEVTPELVASLEAQYDLDQPLMVQYFFWLGNILRGDFSHSMLYNRPVGAILAERLPLTALMSFISFLLLNLMAIPIGIVAAVRQHSLLDYCVTFAGFIGLAVPNFIFALVLMWAVFSLTGSTATVGLMSHQFLDAAWSLPKLLDLLNHLWIPAIVMATAGTAEQVRVMRANLLDELRKPYVTVARAKGVSGARLLLKYPFRVALNPFIVRLGWLLASLMSGELMVSVTLGLPTLAPIMLEATMAQDMFLAGSILFIELLLTVVGILLSDVLLGIVDPRIRDAV